MPRFCANLTMLYPEHGFLDRFAAARADGFKGVEFMFPYDHPKEAIAQALHRNDLVQVLHNLPAGDWAGGERGIASCPTASASSRTASAGPSIMQRRWAARS